MVEAEEAPGARAIETGWLERRFIFTRRSAAGNSATCPRAFDAAVHFRLFRRHASSLAEPFYIGAMNAPETGPVAAEMLRRLNSALSPARIELVGESEQLRDHGLTFDISATTYYQGITGGGLEEGFEFGGRNDYWLNVDGQKAGLWPGFFVTLHGETVYGDSVNAATGAIGHPSRDRHWRRLDQRSSVQGLCWPHID
jgi:hypothetical protein